MRLEVWKGDEGWFGRYSAPGYLDATDECGPFLNAHDAVVETFTQYGEASFSDEPITGDEQEAIDLLIDLGIAPDHAALMVGIEPEQMGMSTTL